MSATSALAILGRSVRAPIAIIAVGFAITAANGAIFARAELRNFDAPPGNVGTVAKARLAVA
jgi:hypothetical protein